MKIQNPIELMPQMQPNSPTGDNVLIYFDKEKGKLVYQDKDGPHFLVIDTALSSKHNDLEGRDEPDCHPMSSITGLADAFVDVDNELSAIREEVVPSTPNKGGYYVVYPGDNRKYRVVKYNGRWWTEDFSSKVYADGSDIEENENGGRILNDDAMWVNDPGYGLQYTMPIKESTILSPAGWRLPNVTDLPGSVPNVAEVLHTKLAGAYFDANGKRDAGTKAYIMVGDSLGNILNGFIGGCYIIDGVTGECITDPMKDTSTSIIKFIIEDETLIQPYEEEETPVGDAGTEEGS